MTPIRYTVKNGITHFHYKLPELINFCRLGFRDGNVGMILMRIGGDLITYKGFGTIEKPIHHIVTLSMVHMERFDGKLPSNDEMLIPPKPFFTPENTKIFMLDMSAIKPEIISPPPPSSDPSV